MRLHREFDHCSREVQWPHDANRGNLPPGLFEEPSTLRILRIDDQLRYITLMAKAHGTRPDSRTDMAMEGFAINYVLRGQGIYRDENGRTHALTPGTLFQRLPGRRHSTILDAASDYAELFLVTGPGDRTSTYGFGSDLRMWKCWRWGEA